MPSALIVCSDDRADDLAAVLANRFQVYGIGFEQRLIWSNDYWMAVSLLNFPSKFDVLFFHTGLNDPDRIPTEIETTREFAFNAPGEPFTTRPKVLPILRSFRSKHCPVTKRDVDEVIDFLDGKRFDPPSMCLTPTNILPAISILCLGYIMVHTNPESGALELEPNDAGFASMERALSLVIGTDLKDGRNMEIFGELKNAEKRKILRQQVGSLPWWQIFQDAEFSKVAAREWGPDKQKGWAEVDTLLTAIQQDKTITPMIVADAYCSIAEKLAESEYNS